MRAWPLFALLWLTPAANGGCIDIPFRWTPGQIEVRVSVNDREPVWFILDSGSEYSIIGSDLAQAIGVTTSSRFGRDFTSGIKLAIGGVTLRDQDLMVFPLANFKAQHRPIQGLVGYDFFDRYVVTLDYQKNTISACDRQSFGPHPQAVRVPLTFAGRLPVVPVVLTLADGRSLHLRAMVDTGAQAAMIVRYPFASAHDLLRTSARAPDAPSVQGLSLPMVRIPSREIAIGRWAIDVKAVQAHAAPVGSGGFAETDALIGNELLREFRVTFDYARHRMLLEK